MFRSLFVIWVLLAIVSIFGEVNGQWNPNFAPGRSTIVHLFEWKWSNIAQECERFLGPFGYGGVQVSPPTENLVIRDPARPWWERYQPISYNLNTRSGDGDAFKSMVSRCNAVGVRIYVDVIINHMTAIDGGGIGGCTAKGLNYPCVPYVTSDFNGPSTCPTKSGEIEDWDDIIEVRNCNLFGLRDLNQADPNAAEKMRELLNKLISYGVAGFRVDASKHMWPKDLAVIYSTLNDLPTNHGFQAGSRAFFFQEVVDFVGGGYTWGTEYFGLGRVTEFRYGAEISNAFRGQNQLKWLQNFGEAWGLHPENYGLAFIDNHDNQRAHENGGNILTFRDAKLYKMAVAFMLAWPYGVTRVMSSYYWEQDFQEGEDKNDWIGPPSTNEVIDDVTFNPDLSCRGDWVCEHRWRQIYNMNIFRNTVEGTPVTNWWDNGANQISFCRGNKGFLAINNEMSNMHGSFQTCLPPGDYCDVISGALVGGQCTGTTITVGSDGAATFSILSTQDDPMIAIHIGITSSCNANQSLDLRLTHEQGTKPRVLESFGVLGFLVGFGIFGRLWGLGVAENHTGFRGCGVFPFCSYNNSGFVSRRSKEKKPVLANAKYATHYKT